MLFQKPFFKAGWPFAQYPTGVATKNADLKPETRRHITHVPKQEVRAGLTAKTQLKFNFNL